MGLESRWKCASLGIICILAHCASSATAAPVPLSVTPSTKWYGIDGTWSAISIRLGSPQQWFDVLVNTVSSETWVPGLGSCIVNYTLCSTNKGNLFQPLHSSTWAEQGFFDLGVEYQLGNTAYAEYGLDNMTFGTTGVSIPSSIIGAYNGSSGTNTTSYFNGLFGLGITPGNFTSVTPLSAISALVEQTGAIPSHSYGYTAGASYQLKGVLNSLTLGGYDANRMVPHDVQFTLSSSKTPQIFVNAISVTLGATVNTTTNTASLLNAADRVTAIIDSSTPFLWLPTEVCERFASALGLTYNDTLNLYTYSNRSQHELLAASNLSFDFGLSDFATASESINITLPYAAFDLKLIYPAIPGTNYGYKDSCVYYFPLRQALNEAQYTIGRAFMQEAYLITDYERNTFSVHQAVHVLDSVSNTSIVAITRPSSSSLTGNPVPTVEAKDIFPKGAVIGIAIGAAAMLTLSVILGILLYRRSHLPLLVSDDKVFDAPPPRRVFMDRFRRPEERAVSMAISVPHKANGSEAFPVEVGADATHERYELAAPMGPLKLESVSGESMDGSTAQGYPSQDTVDISDYERARRKMERQQNLAVIESHIRPMVRPPEKEEQDVFQLTHYQSLDAPAFEVSALDSPMVSPMVAEFGNRLGGHSGQPSPVSPGFPVNVQTPLGAPPPTYLRIDPDHVMYAGRLPDNVQLPTRLPVEDEDGNEVLREYGTHSSLGSQYTLQEEAAFNLYSINADPAFNFMATNSSPVLDLYNADTPPARSPITEPGNNRLQSAHTADIVSPLASTSSGSAAHTFGRWNSHDLPPSPDIYLQSGPGIMETNIEHTEMSSNMNFGNLGGEEFVHVPQLAENRFSWEEERISGRDERHF